MFNWFRKPEPTQPAEPRASVFSTEAAERSGLIGAALSERVKRLSMPRNVGMDEIVTGAGASAAMDSNNFENSLKTLYTMGAAPGVPDAQLLWYAGQGFIGYQMCALLAQNWLVNKACAQPGRDAVRTGYELKVGAQPEVIEAIKKADKRHGIKRNMVQFVKFGRVFGIRLALFVVESTDPEYYKKPFNPDGITPGSYKGVTQVDPYWCSPQLSTTAASDPTAMDFYEPTYWQINGKQIHKSHLVIMRGEEVTDVLKPSYNYGGMSIPQRIYERVYAAERTANEAPMLALSKRTRTLYTDMARVIAKGAGAMAETLNARAEMLNNFGTDVVDMKSDKVEHSDLTLADLDSVIMTQYQIVAAAANIPATKLLGTTPKGFNATGEYEEATYHEELEGIQEHDLSPMLERHHLCVWRSEIAPKFKLDPKVMVEHVWNPTDSLTAKERAEVNKINAETGKILSDAGAIDGMDERDRITNDRDSGYGGLPAVEQPEPVDLDNNPATRPALATPPAAAAPAQPPAAMDGIAMDAGLWDRLTGRLDGAELLSNQDFIDPAKVTEKLMAEDYEVQVTPAFVDPDGRLYRVVIDGHHSLQAAIMAGVMPQFVEANYTGTDYRNVATLTRVGA